MLEILIFASVRFVALCKCRELKVPVMGFKKSDGISEEVPDVVSRSLMASELGDVCSFIDSNIS